MNVQFYAEEKVLLEEWVDIYRQKSVVDNEAYACVDDEEGGVPGELRGKYEGLVGLSRRLEDELHNIEKKFKTPNLALTLRFYLSASYPNEGEALNKLLESSGNEGEWDEWIKNRG